MITRILCLISVLPVLGACRPPLADAALAATADTPPAATMAQPATAASPAPTLTPVPRAPAWPTPVPTVSASETPVLTAATSTTRSSYEESRGAVTLRQTNVTITYLIGGTTPEEIDWQMAMLGPRDALGGYSWYALTEPMFNWEYECACGDQGCQPPTVTILLTIRYTIPHWSQPGMEHDPLVSYWSYFEQALRTHEHGHGDLAAVCAWQLGDAIAAQPAAATCEEFDATIPAATDPVFQSCRAAQRAYEDETNHGESQGVAWPPGP